MDTVRRAASRPARAWRRALPWALAGVALMAVLAVPAPARRQPAPEPATRWPSTAVELSADAGVTTLFALDGLVPGHPATNCVALRFQDVVPGSAVRLYAVVRSGGLAPYLTATVRTGAGAGTATGTGTGTGTGCTGFVAAATPYRGPLTGLTGAGPPGPAPGLPVLRLPAAQGDVTFQITVAVADTDAAQGRAVTFDLVWTAPRPDPAAAPVGRPSLPRRLVGAMHRLGDALWRLAKAVAVPLLAAGSISLTLLGVVAAFLLLQNRIDRRDPKLALAPVRPPVQLGFASRNEFP